VGVLYGESNQSWLHEGDAADKGQFGLYYTCGLLIHQAIVQAVQKKSKGLKNIYSLWNEYPQKVEQGYEKGPETFSCWLNKVLQKRWRFVLKSWLKLSYLIRKKR